MTWYLCQMKNKPYDKITTFKQRFPHSTVLFRNIAVVPKATYCLHHCFLYPRAVCIMKSPYGAVRNLSADCYDLVPLPIEVQNLLIKL